jgi:GTP-binding protein HflX
MKERAVLVTIDFDSIKSLSHPLDAQSELQELSTAAGLFVAKSLLFRQKSPNAPLLVGRGKAQELSEWVKREKADVMVFNSNLSSSQQRNLEEIVQTKTIDRTQLILDIFALRAKSTEGKLQVESAQLKYLLPRLAGKGIYLSRLGGGIGTRGPGEQKLEVDRRRIRERLARLGRELEELDRRRVAAIDQKKQKELPLVALVGYTNAGKSSLFNALTRACVPVKNQLFSTLDTTTRLLSLPSNQKALLADTVGFVRDLPHHLIESFKATLEEAVHADILLHVIDASRPDIEFIETAVKKVLADLDADEKEMFLIFNKIDLLTPEACEAIRQHSRWKHAFLVSARTGEGIDRLLERISETLNQSRRAVEFFLPKEKLGLAGFLYKEGEVLKRSDEALGSYFLVNLSEKAEKVFRKKL